MNVVERVEFLRFAEGGRVHVLDRYDNRIGVPLYAVQVARCGRTGRPGQLHGLDTFDDRELCAQCWRATPPDERSALFTHPELTG